MPKFSIIIPVYNTEKYLKKCLNSVFNQSYKDFEVIVVNDGSTDDSEKTINKYIKKYNNIKYMYQKNQGLSCARNNGILNSTGNYLLFLDSDDYYEKDLLRNIDLSLTTNPDIVRFQVQDVYEDNNVIKYIEQKFNNINGIESFNYISRYHYIEIACSYCFKRSFWLKNKFMFAPNKYHEDYGLIPLVILKCNNICSIDYIGYNYYKREGSITIYNKSDYNKIRKQAMDFLEHFKYLKEKSSCIDGELSIFNSYISNSVILKSTTLKGNDYKKYIKELKKIGAFDMLLDDSTGRKIKKILLKISPKMYYKIVR